MPVIVAGVFTLMGVLLGHYLDKGKDKLSSREVTETKNTDGSVTRRQLEIYK